MFGKCGIVHFCVFAGLTASTMLSSMSLSTLTRSTRFGLSAIFYSVFSPYYFFLFICYFPLSLFGERVLSSWRVFSCFRHKLYCLLHFPESVKYSQCTGVPGSTECRGELRQMLKWDLLVNRKFLSCARFVQWRGLLWSTIFISCW